MRRKIYLFIFAFALILCACGNKSKESPRPLGETMNILVESVADSTLSFEAYQPVFEEILDSIEDVVLNHTDADYRFFARQLPTEMLREICMSEPEYKRERVWNLYEQRQNDILSTWYVQQLVDSTDNAPFIILSYAAPYDAYGNNTRVSFTFSENNNPKSEPVLLITLPRDAYEDEPLVLFTGGNPETDYSQKNGNMDIFGNKEDGMSLGFFGDFLNDMLTHNEIRVIYMNEKVKNYPDISQAPYDECLVQVAVDLKKFQEQYRAAHKWMEGYK